jgi:CopG family transcriptional regulator/antitoxin EndoAI
MSKRINIMLPDRTLAVLDRVARKGNRSRFISEAVLHYVEARGAQSLREQLKTGYLANADENLRIAAEWFPLEEEAWQKSQPGQKAKNKK